MRLTPQELTDLIQEVSVIPANRWTRQKPIQNPHTLTEEEQYLDAYMLEHKGYLLHLDGHYNGATSGTIRFSVFGRTNGRGGKLGEIDTMRKDILIRARQIPTAIADLYDRVCQYYNTQEVKEE